jgi:superfamily I DNA and/or RNA helicase
MTLKDVLVVAPYNVQVGALRRALPDGPDGAKVGTVDKFQGQEAPVVIYSLATSTPEGAPRGMQFLYSPSRDPEIGPQGLHGPPVAAPHPRRAQPPVS